MVVTAWRKDVQWWPPETVVVGGSSEEETGCRLVELDLVINFLCNYKYAVSIFQYAVPYALSLT